MSRYAPILAILVAIMAVPAIAQVTLPQSASVSGVTNTDWPSGMSNLASYGQVIQQRALTVESTDVDISSTDVTITFESTAAIESTTAVINSTDVIVRSGEATETGFVRVDTTASGVPLEPFKTVSSPVVTASRLCGTGYQIGIGPGSRLSSELARNADRIVRFASQDDAFTKLKTLIATGIPVVVDVDFFFLFNEAVTQEPGIAAQGQTHVSRFIVVTGYDQNNVTFTDNGPASELGSTGENIVVSQSAFLSAWAATRTLKTRDAVAGPNFMLIATSKPNLTTAPFTFVYDGEDGALGPDKIRLASRIVALGRRHDALLQDASLFSDTRRAMADFATANVESTSSGIADDYATSSFLWRSLVESTDTTGEAGTLAAIANAEDQGLAAMRSVDTSVAAIELLGPADGAVVDDVTGVAFRWAALPEVGKTVLQISTTGDFSTSSGVVTVVPRSQKTSVILTPAQALRVLSLESTVTSIAWRVRGSGVSGGIASNTRTLVLMPQQITALSPPSGVTVSATSLPTFVFSAPGTAMRPRVVLSTDGSFSKSGKTRMVLVPRKGQPQVTMTQGQFKSLERRKKDDTDRTVFWRVEDGLSAKTDVQSSQTSTFVLVP